MNIIDYIDENLPRCICYSPENSGTLIGLLYPYIVPCASDGFREMYYWDTYFTHKGLLIRGDLQQIRNDIDNMRYLIREYGFMPNGNRTFYLYNSQPPFLSMMMRDYYEVEKNKEWLEGAYEDLKLEYKFWKNYRMSDIGLNRYDCMKIPEEMVPSAARSFQERTGLGEGEREEDLARAMHSSGESGWDMNPRMAEKTYQYASVDLNSLMYAMEENLRYFAEELGREQEAGEWTALRDKRGCLCREFLKDLNGLFMDYNYVTNKHITIFSAASFYPLYCGMATREEAETTKNALSRIETGYGIVTCEKSDVLGNYQWGYPNGWAPMQLIVVEGLLRYGYKEDACRIAQKFISLVERCYEESGHFWEKYNVVEGNADVQNEYEMPAMLGWTFGVYMWLKELCKLL